MIWMAHRHFHYLRKLTDPAIKRISAGLLKNHKPQHSYSRKGTCRQIGNRSERKVDTKAPIKAVTKLSVNNSDIHYQKHLSFNLENTLFPVINYSFLKTQIRILFHALSNSQTWKQKILATKSQNLRKGHH